MTSLAKLQSRIYLEICERGKYNKSVIDAVIIKLAHDIEKNISVKSGADKKILRSTIKLLISLIYYYLIEKGIVFNFTQYNKSYGILSTMESIPIHPTTPTTPVIKTCKGMRNDGQNCNIIIKNGQYCHHHEPKSPIQTNIVGKLIPNLGPIITPYSTPSSSSTSSTPSSTTSLKLQCRGITAKGLNCNLPSGIGQQYCRHHINQKPQ